MRRREFIRVVGWAAVAWPLTARAQPRMPTIGVLMQSVPDDTEYQSRLADFVAQMHELGWDDGRNVRIIVHWGYRNPDRVAAEAKALIDLEPNVILTTNTATTQALQKQTRTLPIVFASISDPLASGVVTSLAHPDAKVTGFSNYEFSVGAKWLELLKSAAPNLARILVLTQPNNDGNPAADERDHVRVSGERAAILLGQCRRCCGA
jgi:putative ABC transport system substrate-binding protein